MKILYICLMSFLAASSIVSAQSISVNEALSINIKGVPAAEQTLISGPYTVDSKGYVHMPLIKPVKASGATISTLARRIEASYKKAGIYTDPTINISSPQDQREREDQEVKIVTIGGYVKAPGSRPYRKGMTLFQAISAAGGQTTFGSLRRVELYHKGKKKVYDVRKIQAKQIRVYPGDTINVPQKRWNNT